MPTVMEPSPVVESLQPQFSREHRGPSRENYLRGISQKKHTEYESNNGSPLRVKSKSPERDPMDSYKFSLISRFEKNATRVNGFKYY